MTGSRPASGFGSAREVALVFLRLGVVAFGGPAAHTAMMRQELVQRRKWLTDERFVDLMGATNLIPGPNSTELAIHLGHERAGWRGLLLAGVLFILPAAVIVTVLAWVYVEHGDTPAFDHVLYGVVPVVVAIIVWALVPLARTVVKSRWLAVLLAAGLAAYLLGVNELVVLFGGAAIALVVHAGRSLAGSGRQALVLAALPVFEDPTAGQLATLFVTMLKIGAVLYGSGYVLLAFLEGDFVDRLGWITHQQLLDAIADRPGHARAGVHDRDVRRLPGRRAPRGLPRDGRDLPAVVRLRRAAHPAGRLAAVALVDLGAAGRAQRHRAGADGRGLLDAGTGRPGRRLDGRAVRGDPAPAVADPAQLRRGTSPGERWPEYSWAWSVSELT